MKQPHNRSICIGDTRLIGSPSIGSIQSIEHQLKIQAGKDKAKESFEKRQALRAENESSLQDLRNQVLEAQERRVNRQTSTQI